MKLTSLQYCGSSVLPLLKWHLSCFRPQKILPITVSYSHLNVLLCFHDFTISLSSHWVTCHWLYALYVFPVYLYFVRSYLITHAGLLLPLLDFILIRIDHSFLDPSLQDDVPWFFQAYLWAGQSLFSWSPVLWFGNLFCSLLSGFWTPLFHGRCRQCWLWPSWTFTFLFVILCRNFPSPPWFLFCLCQEITNALQKLPGLLLCCFSRSYVVPLVDIRMVKILHEDKGLQIGCSFHFFGSFL